MRIRTASLKSRLNGRRLRLRAVKFSVRAMERRPVSVAIIDRDRESRFISREGGADVFVHYSAIAAGGFRKLLEGQRVKFEVDEGKTGKGPQAMNVSVAE